MEQKLRSSKFTLQTEMYIQTILGKTIIIHPNGPDNLFPMTAFEFHSLFCENII